MALGFGAPESDSEPEPPSRPARPAAPSEPTIAPDPTGTQKLWKRSRRAKREEEKRTFKTSDDVLREAPAAAQTVIDMRGPRTRVLSSMEDVGEVPYHSMEEDVPMPELQHNMRLVVELV